MIPKYKPTTLGMALGYLVEESGEVLAAAGKSLRWGLLSFNPDLPPSERETNLLWLKRELLDLERAIRFIRDGLDQAGERGNFDLECPIDVALDAAAGRAS